MKKRKWIALMIVLPVFLAGVIIEMVCNNGYANFTDTVAADYLWEETVIRGYGANKVVQLFVEDVITSEATNAGVLPMSEKLKEQLRRAEEDEAVKAIVLRINSPGGEVVATDELYRRLLQIKKQKGIPIVISMGTMAASGGYYLAAAGDYIFANPNTLTGSLGVIFRLYNYDVTAERLGIKEYAIKSVIYKDIGSPMRPLAEAERKILQSLVNESHENFINVIVNGRKLSREHVLRIADGRIYSGVQARNLGLIDNFGDLDDATAYAAKLIRDENASVVRYEDIFSLNQFILGMQQKWTSHDLLGLERLAARRNQPKLLYQYLP